MSILKNKLWGDEMAVLIIVDNKTDYKKFCKEYEKVESGKKRPCEVMRDLKLNESTYYRYRKRYLTEHKKGEWYRWD